MKWGLSLKIFQINSVCGVGSTGRIANDLYKIAESQGHVGCIAYGRGSAPEDIHSIRIGSDLDVCLHALYTRITDKTAFASKNYTRLLIDTIVEFDPDIIHLHNLHGYYINIELLFQYLKATRKPVVWSLYDCWPFTGHCYHFDYIGCDKWKTGCYQCVQKKDYPTSYLFDASKENYLRKKAFITACDNIVIVPPTQWLADLVKESFLNKFKSIVIPSGIDLDKFKPTPSNLRKKYQLEDKKIVLGVSNGFSKNKGAQYFNELAQKLPDHYKLVLIGVREEQRKLFPKDILTLPRTDSMTELAEFYTAADVFVNPTLQETQGLTNIEALACGTGVVTFNSGGCPECIDKSCGFVVERGDLQGLIKAVIQTCTAPFDHDACIQKAALFDQSKLYKEYIKLYEEINNHKII